MGTLMNNGSWQKEKSSDTRRGNCPVENHPEQDGGHLVGDCEKDLLP
jgi:hypothetical protein